MRTDFSIPQGAQCLNQTIPEAQWNLPGLFVFDEYYFSEWKMLGDFFAVKAPVGSISGSRNVLWNSGRVSPEHSNQGGTKKRYLQILNQYKKFGVNCFYTFSNHLLTEKDLGDRVCAEMLEAMVENGHDGDGVIIASDLLSDHIRSKYPSLKQKVSVIKSDVEMPKERTASWYNDLAGRFDVVVLQPDDNFNLPLLENLIRKEKFELLVNEPCVKGCRYRKRHYDDTAKISLEGSKDFTALKKYFETGGICGQMNYTHPNPALRTKSVSCRLTREETAELYRMGFRLFKLQGRTNHIQLAYDISYYLFDNGYFSSGEFTARMSMILNK